MRKSKEASIFYDDPNTNESASKLEDGSEDNVVVSGRYGEKSRSNLALNKMVSQNIKVNINYEYDDIQSMKSRPDLDRFDELDMDYTRTIPNFSNKDPDIPITEDLEVHKKFPFVRSLEYGKPIETRLRASMRTI